MLTYAIQLANVLSCLKYILLIPRVTEQESIEGERMQHTLPDGSTLEVGLKC